MKTLYSLVIFVVSLSALAAEQVDERREVVADGQVEIKNVRGEIEIEGWDDNVVQVKGRLDDLAESFIFNVDGDKTTIRVELPRESRYRSREGSRLKIRLPKSSKVSFSGVATDLTIRHLNKGIHVNSVSGDVFISDLKGSTYINSVSGNLRLESINGGVHISTVSGGLKANIESEHLKVRSVSGDLDIALTQITQASLSSVSGDMQLSGKLTEGGRVMMKSITGKAQFRVPSQLDAKFIMHTAPGGKITNEYSEDQPTSSFINAQSLEFSSGSAASLVKMSTVSGEVALKKE